MTHGSMLSGFQLLETQSGLAGLLLWQTVAVYS